MDKEQPAARGFFPPKQLKKELWDYLQTQTTQVFKCPSTCESEFITSEKKGKNPLYTTLTENRIWLFDNWLFYINNNIINITGWHTRFKHFPCLEPDLFFHWYWGAFNLYSVTYQ